MNGDCRYVVCHPVGLRANHPRDACCGKGQRKKRAFSLRGITMQRPRVLDFVNRFMADNLRRVNERSFVLGHLLVALRTTGSEFPKPANHEIPVVVLVGLPNGGLLEFMNRQPTVRRVVPRYHWHVQPFLSEFFLAPLLCLFFAHSRATP